jgi:prepilin-type N-terminal cleavage/methylation domain-containing protein
MPLKNRAGFTLTEVLISTAIFSGLALTIAELVDQSNLQLAAYDLRQNIINEHHEIEKILLDQQACFNTFGPLNVAGPLGGATLAAPVNVLTIRDNTPPPPPPPPLLGGIMLHTPGPGIGPNNYLPRALSPNPLDQAVALTNSRFFLLSVRVLRANNTDNFVALNAETNIPPRSFYVEFRYKLNEINQVPPNPNATVSDSMVRAFGLNGEFPRYVLFSAQFQGLNITQCNSAIETELDDILVNADPPLINPIANPAGFLTEPKNRDLDISGRLHVEDPSEGLWAERFYHNSDLSLKTNIRKFPNPLKNILRLRGVEFDWIKTGQHDWGLVAQEVEEVFPSFVFNKNKSDLKSVSYDSFVAPIIESQKILRIQRHLLSKEKQEIENSLIELENKNKESDL